jgi:hypothetical protein
MCFAVVLVVAGGAVNMLAAALAKFIGALLGLGS